MLTTSQIAALLQTTIHLLETEVAVLSEPITRFRPAPHEWCINEVVGHLIETEERGFAGRIQRMLAQPDYVCEDWDPDQVARDRRDDEQQVTVLLEVLAKQRAASIRFVQTLTTEQRNRTTEHPRVGILSVNDLLHEWVYHDRNHIKQIMSNLQAWVWPAMGNAQRFTVG